VLYGRCDEGLAVPYQSFVEALRPYAVSRPGSTEIFLFGIPAHHERGRCVVLSSVEGFEFRWGDVPEG
jgi:hypothetical protein